MSRAIRNVALNLSVPSPKKDTNPNFGAYLQPSGKVSMICQKAKHYNCYSLACVCPCHKRNG